MTIGSLDDSFRIHANSTILRRTLPHNLSLDQQPTASNTVHVLKLTQSLCLADAHATVLRFKVIKHYFSGPMFPQGSATLIPTGCFSEASLRCYLPSMSRTFCLARLVAILAGVLTKRWQRSMSELLVGKSSGFWRRTSRTFSGAY
jgi:hypothetical protein